MDWKTLLIYILMYVYGFSLTIWAIFFDKHPTKRSYRGAVFGLIALFLTLFYFFYVLWTIGMIDAVSSANNGQNELNGRDGLSYSWQTLELLSVPS